MTSSIELLKAQSKAAAQELEAKKAELAAAMKSLKAEMAKAKDLEKEAKEKEKKAQAQARAEAIKAAWSGAQETKVNMTEEIRVRLLQGMDIDSIEKETGFGRKAILDRVWLIEKKLGIR